MVRVYFHLRSCQKLDIPKCLTTIANEDNLICTFEKLWMEFIRIELDFGNGLLFHMTQPTSRSTMKAIACSKPTISEN